MLIPLAKVWLGAPGKSKAVNTPLVSKKLLKGLTYVQSADLYALSPGTSV